MKNNKTRSLQSVVPAVTVVAERLPVVAQRAIPAVVTVAELCKAVLRIDRKARREAKRCFGLVRGKGPEYFTGHSAALVDLLIEVNRTYTATVTGGNT